MDFYLQLSLDAIQRETSGMSASQLAWSRNGRWSAGQILEHLALAFSSTGKLMERILAQGRPQIRKRTAREWIITLLVIKIGYFPTGRQAPEWTVPRGLAPEKAVETVRAALAEMDEKIGAAQNAFGNGVIAVHSIIGPLTAQQWRKFHWEHTRHHMKQIAALRAASARQQAASA